MNPLTLAAEALVWPLADEKAFLAAAPVVDGAQLRASAEARIRELGGDEGDLAAYADAWPAPQHRETVLAYVRRHGHRLLEPWGETTRLRAIELEPADAILRWRAVSLASPAAIWNASVAPRRGAVPRATRVLHRALSPLSPVSHQHVHAGATMPFEVVWTRLASRCPITQVAKSRAVLGGHALAHWLARAWVARRWLASKLNLHHWPLQRGELRLVREAIDDLRRGRVDGGDPGSRTGLTRRLSRLARSAHGGSQVRSVRDVMAGDPLCPLGPWPEGVLLRAILHTDGLDDPTTQIAVQYLRIKTALHRHLVHDPARPSLGQFVETYMRMDAFECDLKHLAPEHMAVDADMSSLGAVELRVPPKPSVHHLADLVTERGATGRRGTEAPNTPEVGWTLHLLRNPMPKDRVGSRHLRTHSLWPLRMRFRDHLRCARATERALERWPQLLAVIRSVDIASHEREGPLFVAVPALVRLVEASKAAASRAPDVEPLRTTLHLGEDYRHLLAGVRAAYQALRWGLLRAGDRIGHGFSLSEDIEAWVQRHPSVAQPQWERLLDLLALRDACTVDPSGVANLDRVRLDDEVGVLGKTIWQSSQVTPSTLATWFTALGTPDLLEAAEVNARRSVSTSSLPPPAGATSRWLTKRLFHDHATARRATEEVVVPTHHDAESMRFLQRLTRTMTSQRDVAIELNPSSNHIIKGTVAPLDQPAFQGRAVSAIDGPTIPVTLNADDPSTFATRQSDEFAYAWAGLVAHANVDPMFAREWIEDAARNSWRFRFTLPVSRNLERLPAPGLGRRHWRQIG